MGTVLFEVYGSYVNWAQYRHGELKKKKRGLTR